MRLNRCKRFIPPGKMRSLYGETSEMDRMSKDRGKKDIPSGGSNVSKSNEQE